MTGARLNGLRAEEEDEARRPATAVAATPLSAGLRGETRLVMLCRRYAFTTHCKACAQMAALLFLARCCRRAFA